MALPHFIVIGAAKSGTTSLYALLDRHERIFMPKIKEPEFFARDDLYEAPGGLAAYEATYEAARPGQLIGEASTLYTLSPLFPKTAGRVRAHCPEAKLVYILREPVSRAYSFYVQLIKNYQNATKDYAVHRSFEEFILPERRAGAAPRGKVLSHHNAHLPDVAELCLAGSDYVAQIEAWLAHFDRSRMLFLKFEDFRADRQGTVRRITDFLGIEPLADAVFAEAAVTRNISADHFAALGETAALAPLKARAGGLWGARRLVPGPVRAALRQAVVAYAPPTAHEPPPMEPATRALLEARYRPQFDRLSELTGLDLSDWRNGA